MLPLLACKAPLFTTLFCFLCLLHPSFLRFRLAITPFPFEGLQRVPSSNLLVCSRSCVAEQRRQQQSVSRRLLRFSLSAVASAAEHRRSLHPPDTWAATGLDIWTTFDLFTVLLALGTSDFISRRQGCGSNVPSSSVVLKPLDRSGTSAPTSAPIPPKTPIRNLRRLQLPCACGKRANPAASQYRFHSRFLACHFLQLHTSQTRLHSSHAAPSLEVACFLCLCSSLHSGTPVSTHIFITTVLPLPNIPSA